MGGILEPGKNLQKCQVKDRENLSRWDLSILQRNIHSSWLLPLDTAR